MKSHIAKFLSIAGAASLAFAGGARADETPVRVLLSRPAQPDVLFIAADAQPGAPTAPPAPDAPRDVLIQADNPINGGEPQIQPLGELTPGKFWIGVMCAPADEALRAQLKQPEDVGVVVQDIVPDSPAAKAGLQKFDLIVAAGDRKIGDIATLMKAVEDSGEKPLVLGVIRGGEATKIEVTPGERQVAAVPAPPVPPDAPRDVWRLLERFRQDGEGGPVMRFFHPGVVIPPAAHQPMPENLIVRIEKHGSKPAKIHVEQDGKTWDVTEDKLDDLPEEVRGHVAPLVGRGPGRPFSIRLPEGAGEQFDIQIAPPPPGNPNEPIRSRVRAWTEQAEEGAGERLDKRLEQLNERIDRLQQLIEKLQAKEAETKDAPPRP